MVFHCCVCNRKIIKEFVFYCRQCYRSYLYVLKITNHDFINYINLSFKCKLTLSNTGCKFREVHSVLKLKYDILNLDRILENILYIKMVTNTTIYITSIRPLSRRPILRPSPAPRPTIPTPIEVSVTPTLAEVDG